MSSFRVWRVMLLVVLAGIFSPAREFLRAQEPAILRRVRIDPNRLVDFHAIVTPETLFVNQQATYQVAVMLDQAADGRLPRNPEYLPPELRGLLAYDLGGQQRFAHQANGKNYTTYVFQKALFPLATGTITIPSPQLSYALRQTSSYFSREDSHTLKAESSTVVVRPLPEEGRPADFGGAVGVLKAVVQLDAAVARVGDPLVLTLRVSGSGNIKLLPRPTLEVEWATNVPGTERLHMDTSSSVVRGSKEFDWILTPTRAGDVSTPAIDYSYFNPNTRKYETTEAAPVQFAINAGSLVGTEPGEKSTTVLKLRGHEVGTVDEPLLGKWEVWVALGLLPLPALALLLLGVPREEPEAAAIEKLRSMVVPAAVAMRATSKQSAQPEAIPTTARDVRRLLLASLARRLEMGTDVFSDRRRARRVLRRRGITAETTEALLVQLNALDVASFASMNVESTAITSTLSTQALALYDRVDNEALEPRAQRVLKASRNAAKVATAILVAMVVGISSVGTIAAQSNGGVWERAITDYSNRQFNDAATGFQDLSKQFPRDPDVLANWGSAAWAAGDTVTAVVAWQRAARLDPLAADLREHLLLLPSGSRDGVADIPMVPVAALTVAGIVLWTFGWALAAWQFGKKRKQQSTKPILSAVASILVVLGVGGGATAQWGAQHLQADGLAVVLRPETMRETPESGANAEGGAATGDVVRIDELVPRWAHVEHADGRTGWLPQDHLTLLSSSTPR
ncbi:MAG: BatD family protein [Gemmatimonas sp.]